MTIISLDVLKNFPQLKLSYDTLSHKKVNDADIIFAIPLGKKCFVWFTIKDNQPICYILELDRQSKIIQGHLYPTCFQKALSYGSIFYGTFFHYNSTPFVTLEDIYVYKGRKVNNIDFKQKLELFLTIFRNELKQKSPGRHFVSFGLPLFHRSHEKLLDLIHPNQRIMYFQYRYYHKRNIIRIKPSTVIYDKSERGPNPESIKPSYPIKRNQDNSNKTIYDRERVFTVSPDLQNDIYHLHDNKNKYIGVAFVPDYKTSVMLNKLFRNIKENSNLDTLEESDDEDEFECEDEDKFVYLDKKYNMSCFFNRKFKMWVPTKIYQSIK